MRVLTWNLWWQFGDWQRRLQAIRAVLAEVKPDICCFQEAWTGPDGNQAELLAAEFDMFGGFAPSPGEGWRRRLPGSTAGVGNAVISRWPIAETAICHLMSEDGRNVLHAAIDAPGGRLDVFTTQFSPEPYESAARVRQVQDTLRFVVQQSTGAYPPILTGDLGAEADSDEVRLLGGQKTKPYLPKRVLIDAWRYAETPTDGWTWDRRNPYVQATFEPSARIDYIFVGPPAADGRGHVERVALVGDQAVDGVWPSHHAGIVVDLAA